MNASPPIASRTRRALVLRLPAALALLSPLVAGAVDAVGSPNLPALDGAIRDLQHDWEVIRYQTPAGERARRFEALGVKAHTVTEAFPHRSEPLVWEGIIVSSLAGERGGFAGLGLAKQAKALFEAAIAIDDTVLDGSALNSLGVLYYKVPGWPLGFGSKDKAKALLLQALAVNPDGIDPNFFYGEFLLESDHPAEAVKFLEHALEAPPRPGRQVADTGRREEARDLLRKAHERI